MKFQNRSTTIIGLLKNEFLYLTHSKNFKFHVNLSFTLQNYCHST